jgi:ATP-binding cassette subfamily B protein
VLLERPLPPNAAWMTRMFGSQPGAAAAAVSLTIIMIAMANAFFSYMNKYLMSVVGETMVVERSRAHLHHLQALSLNFHDKSRSGDLVVRPDVGHQQAEEAVHRFDPGLRQPRLPAHRHLRDAHLDGLEAVPAGVLDRADPVLHDHYFSTRVKVQQKDKRNRESDVASIVSENMASISLIQAYQAEAGEHARFQKQNQKSLDAEIAPPSSPSRSSAPCS